MSKPQCDEQLRKETEAHVKLHWPEAPISLSELIQERWNKKPEEGQKNDKFNYVVFIDSDGDLDWIADSEYAKERMPEGSSALIARIMDAETYPSGALATGYVRAYKLMLGHSIVSALEGDREAALTLLDNAINYLRRRVCEASRLHTLVVTIALTGVFWCLTRSFDADFCMWGLWGAFVSIVQRSARRSADANAGWIMHGMEVLVFLLVGMLSGRLGVLFVDSPIAPSFLKELVGSPNGMLLMAFFSGMSQGFIPSMISKYVVSTES